MPIDGIERELKQLKDALENAHRAFKDEDYVSASQLYVDAIALLEKTFSSEHPDFALCLENLGDSYFQREQFAQALPVYKRLLTLRCEDGASDKHPYCVVLFKLAKTLEKMFRGEEAYRQYEQALDACQKCLAENDPLTAIIVENFAVHLRKTRRQPELIAAMEQKAQQLRKHSKSRAPYVQNALKALKPSLEEASQAKFSEAWRGFVGNAEADAASKRGPAAQGGTPNPVIIVVCLMALLVFGCVFFLRNGTQSSQTETGATAPSVKKEVVPELGEDIVVNGGFEYLPANAATAKYDFSNLPQISGWTVGKGVPNFKIGATDGPAKSGDVSLDLDCCPVNGRYLGGSVVQQLATAPHQNYKLKFYAMADKKTQLSWTNLKVVAGSLVTNVPSIPQGEWTPFEFTFESWDSGTTPLSFESFSQNGHGLRIDDISVRKVTPVANVQTEIPVVRPVETTVSTPPARQHVVQPVVVKEQKSKPAKHRPAVARPVKKPRPAPNWSQLQQLRDSYLH